ncbi:unnamed protein product [Dibothriocephalus latus]|uniref:Uncharacterized protein n=1 Tax=Dibothriocephalus latus TaxID=60516 RepID=A0A3P6T1K9_DIBLA|nr:unnamed protein product [Dibothriocephalus latus]
MIVVLRVQRLLGRYKFHEGQVNEAVTAYRLLVPFSRRKRANFLVVRHVLMCYGDGSRPVDLVLSFSHPYTTRLHVTLIII